MFISYILKTTQLIFFIFCGSYFTGMIWFIFCQFREKVGDDEFIGYFELEEKSNMEIVILMLYYSFTTLSTVGLGDFHPRGNSERIIGSFFMLFGAMITTHVMGSFTRMLDQIRFFNKSFEQND